MKSGDIDLIWKYLEGDLTKEDTALFGNRLHQDHLFTKLYLEQSEIYRALCKTETIEFRRKLQQLERELKKGKSGNRMILFNYTWLIAAAIGVILISTGCILLRLMTEVPAATPAAFVPKIQESGDYTPSHNLISPQIVREVPNDSAIESKEILQRNLLPVDQSLLAECYKSIPVFEELIDVHYRSAPFNVTSPENGSVFSRDEPVLFRYDAAVVADSLYLTIMNNTARVILIKPLTYYEYLFKSDLEEGLYYFQFTTQNEILYTGKFFVK